MATRRKKSRETAKALQCPSCGSDRVTLDQRQRYVTCGNCTTVSTVLDARASANVRHRPATSSICPRCDSPILAKRNREIECLNCHYLWRPLPGFVFVPPTPEQLAAHHAAEQETTRRHFEDFAGRAHEASAGLTRIRAAMEAAGSLGVPYHSDASYARNAADYLASAFPRTSSGRPEPTADVWVTREGERVPVVEMTDRHLQATVALYRRKWREKVRPTLTNAECDALTRERLVTGPSIFAEIARRSAGVYVQTGGPPVGQVDPTAAAVTQMLNRAPPRIAPGARMMAWDDEEKET